MKSEDPEVVATFADVRQAEFAWSVLEGSGIEAFIDQPFTGNIAPYLTIGSRNVRLLVRHEDLERARAVLAEPEPSEPEGEP